MGVPGLYKLIRERYGARTITPGFRDKISTLIFDLNSLLHNVAAKVYGYDESFGTEEQRRTLQQQMARDKLEVTLESDYLEQVWMAIQTKSQLWRPDQLVIMIDGPPPLAKVQQQKLRRFKAGLNPSPLFDSNAITPGTELMRHLTNELRQRLEADGDKLNASFVMFSGPDEPGEGEHKFMELMRENRIGGPYTKLIHGLDADLILLSLLSPQDKIVILHEEADGRTEFLHIDELKKMLQLLMATPTAIPDFVMLCFLVGNDFAPRPLAAGSSFHEDREGRPGRFPSSNVPEVVGLLTDIYSRMKLPLTTRGLEVRWDNFAIVLAKLAEYEPVLARRVLEAPQQPTWLLSASKAGGRFDYPTFRALWYKMALTAFPGMSEADLGQFSSILGVGDLRSALVVTPADITGMCRDYLRMLAWSFHYYSKGAELPRGTPEVVDLTAAQHGRQRGPASTGRRARPATEPEGPLLSLLAFYPNVHAPLYSDLAIVAANSPPGSTEHLAGGLTGDFRGDRAVMSPPELLLAVLPPHRDALGRPLHNPLVPKEYRWLVLPRATGVKLTIEQLLAAVPAEAADQARQRLSGGGPTTEAATGKEPTVDDAYRLFVSARVKDPGNRIVLSEDDYRALQATYRKPVPTTSPIFDMYPVDFAIERYHGEPSNEIPRIPLVDYGRLHAAFADIPAPPQPAARSLVVRAEKSSLPPRAPPDTLAQRYAANRELALSGLKFKPSHWAS